MLDSLRVAAVATGSEPGRTGDNLKNIAAWSSRACAEGAQLVLFPELSITGFLPNHPAADHSRWLREALGIARRVAEPVPGPAVNALAETAQRTGIYIAAGLLEDAGNLLYNTHVLVGPEGLAGRWRKMHVPMFEMPFYNGGPAPQVADTKLGRIAANICFDALIPESTRLLAVRNVEIVLFPFAADPPPVTPEGWAAWAGPALRARCVENGVFGLACNYAGHVACAGAEQSFPGGCMAVGPSGELLPESETAGGAMRIAEFSREALRHARSQPEYLFRFRRPELYRTLAQ
jgi:predicted amidohydrolase